MNLPDDYSFTRYLTAKKSVDDRALNQDVWHRLRQNIPPGAPDMPLRILEIGAGTGAMFERLLDWGLFEFAEYTALDAQPANLAVMRTRLYERAAQNICKLTLLPDGRLSLEQDQRRALIKLQPGDLFDFIKIESGNRTWDLLAAHAFLDLIDIPVTMPQLFELVEPAGWFYFTINFDGATVFEPQIEPDLDDRIQRLYHLTMDQRLVNNHPSGDSRSGRHLFGHLRQAGGLLLAAGSSDWVVFPGMAGYPEDERYFLHFIIHTITKALVGHQELNANDLQRWAEIRHAQIERGELVYIAHQLDFFGQVSAHLAAKE